MCVCLSMCTQALFQCEIGGVINLSCHDYDYEADCWSGCVYHVAT